MSDPLVRIGLIAGALALAGLVTLWLRARAERSLQKVATNLADGVHFFSSTACSTCRTARRALAGRLGASGFVEHSWEAEPRLFHELGVEAVPASLVVSSGSGTLYPGDPSRMLASL